MIETVHTASHGLIDGAVRLAQAAAPVLPPAAPPPVPAEQGAFPPFNFATFPSSLFWLAVSFGLLYWLTKRLIVPRVGGILEERADRIAADLGEANRLREETDSVIAAYEKELADARARAHGIAQERRDVVKRELDAQRAETERSLQQRISESEARIGKMRDEALAEVDTIASDAAAAIIAKITPLEVARPEIEAEVARLRGEAEHA